LKRKRIEPIWSDEPCIVAASGPSLTEDVVNKVRSARWFNSWRVICINDAYKRMPRVDILYAADERWWARHEGAKDFVGERWSCYEFAEYGSREKLSYMETYGLNLVNIADGNEFSTDPAFIRSGRTGHSGFQALNLALLLGSPFIVMVGFDCRIVDGMSHFFGDHPDGLRRNGPEAYAAFAKSYVPNSRIVNATPGSAIDVYQRVELDEALRWDDRVHRNGPVADAGTNRECAA
jgi:hypothetical protein